MCVGGGEGGIVKCSSHGHFHLNWRRCRRAAVGTRRRPLNCFTELCTRHSRGRGATPCRGKSTILLFFFQTCWLKRFQVGQFCARASNDRRRDNQVAFFPGRGFSCGILRRWQSVQKNPDCHCSRFRKKKQKTPTG